jgi:hypothetical protein
VTQNLPESVKHTSCLRKIFNMFFVGILQRTILGHVLEHYGLVECGTSPDKLGKLILDNGPRSNGWVVDLLSPEDCKPIIREVTPLF